MSELKPVFEIFRVALPDGEFCRRADVVELEHFDAQRLRADTAESDSTRKDGVIEDLMQSNSDMTTCLAAAEQRIAELERDAARYQWLRDKSQNHDQFYLSTPLYFTGVKFSKDNVDRTIDAAINPNPEAESHD